MVKQETQTSLQLKYRMIKYLQILSNNLFRACFLSSDLMPQNKRKTGLEAWIVWIIALILLYIIILYKDEGENSANIVNGDNLPL